VVRLLVPRGAVHVHSGGEVAEVVDLLAEHLQRRVALLVDGVQLGRRRLAHVVAEEGRVVGGVVVELLAKRDHVLLDLRSCSFI